MIAAVTGFTARALRSRDALFSFFVAALCGALLLVPTGFEERLPEGVMHAKGRIVGVDNTDMQQFGLVRAGSQSLDILVLDGPFKGRQIEADNTLLGKMELDTVFQKGDRAFLNLSVEGDRIVSARAVDHYRLDIELGLFALFSLLLVCLGGWVGLRALLSFVFTALFIWKLLLPGFLNGINPIPIAFLSVSILTGAIVFLVGGITRRGLVAFIGALLGLTTACFLAMLFSGPFALHGAVRPFSETLLYSGFPGISLSQIFLAGIFIACSGAIMDLAMDLAASMWELHHHNPHLTRWQLFRSGLTIARAVTGTMTTTLLLAYSGGYLTMMMLFMGRGVPLLNVLNLNYVSAEILHTLAGSFALVATAPFTAAVAALMWGAPAVQPAPHPAETASLPVENP